jgi:hypothetical protein
VPGPYRILPGDGPPSAVGDTTAYTLGVEFYVTTGGLYLYGFWWWCAGGADPSPKAFQLFACVSDVIGTPVDGAAATSGPLTQGAWNYTALAAPAVLGSGQHYRAGVLGGGSSNWYSAVPNAWPADVVHGPLVGVATANALGGLQGSFNTGAAMAYPRFVGNGASYGIDVSVSEAPVLAQTGTAAPGRPTGPAAGGGTGAWPRAGAGTTSQAYAQGGAPA